MQELNKIELYISSTQWSTVAFLHPGFFHCVSTIFQGLRILCTPQREWRGTMEKAHTFLTYLVLSDIHYFCFHSIHWDFMIGPAYMQRRLGNVAPLWRVSFQKQHSAMKGEARTAVDSFPHPKQIMWDGLEVAKNVPWGENVQEREMRGLVNESAGLTVCPSTLHPVHSNAK